MPSILPLGASFSSSSTSRGGFSLIDPILCRGLVTAAVGVCSAWDDRMFALGIRQSPSEASEVGLANARV
jgi:hypothetical protein